MNQQYTDYLKSHEWQEKRSERLKIDNYTCQRCGGKHYLNVHHLSYTNVGNEDIYNDLITLCESCHEKIENGKMHREPIETEEMRNCRLRKEQATEFIELVEKLDLFAKGSVDFCRNETIREHFAYFRKLKGYEDIGVAVKMINDHFRDKRYEVMEKALADNPDISAWQMSVKTGFKYQFVDKFLKRKRR
jgi:hypothetical protein